MQTTGINILLRFLVDKNSQGQAKEAISQIENSAKSIGSGLLAPSADFKETAGNIRGIAKDFGMSIDEAARRWEGMESLGGKTYQQIMADEQAMRAFEEETAKATEQLGQMDKQATASGRSITKISRSMIGFQGFLLAMSGRTLRMAGKSMLSPVGKYIDYAESSEATSARWKKSTEDIEASVVRIGRSMADQMLPTMEKIADIVDTVAGFVEKNPGLAKAGTVLAGGAIVAGMSMTYVGQTIAGISAIKDFIKGVGVASGAGAGAGTAGAAGAGALGVLGPALAGIAGLGLGFAGADALSKTKFGQSIGLQSFGKYATVGAYEAGSIFGPETARKWASAIGRLTGAIEDADKATEKMSSSLGVLSSEQMDLYLDYKKDIDKAEQEYQENRASLIADYLEQESSALESYQSTVSDITTAYRRNEAKEEKDYYRQRADLARDYNQDVVDMEEDHQQKLLDLQRDYQYKILDAARKNDVPALIDAMRSYERSRVSEEESYNREANRKHEDYAQKIAELEENFAIQRQYRMEDYQQQLKDAEAAYKAQRAEAAKSYQQSLKDLDDNYQKERLERRNALIENLKDLQSGLQAERSLRQQFTAAMLNDLRAAIQEAGVTTTGLTVTSRAVGGYVGDELVRTHDGEFVLNASTTSAIERVTSGKLSQERVLAAIGGGTNSGSKINLTIYGDLSDDTRRKLERWVDNRFSDKLKFAFGG